MLLISLTKKSPLLQSLCFVIMHHAYIFLIYLSLFYYDLHFYIIRILQFYINRNYVLKEYKKGKLICCQILSPDTDVCVLPPSPASAFPVFRHQFLLLRPSHAPVSAPCSALARSSFCSFHLVVSVLM